MYLCMLLHVYLGVCIQLISTTGCTGKLEVMGVVGLGMGMDGNDGVQVSIA